MEIIPAILTDSIEEAKAMLSLSDTVATRTQVDIIDGIFVNNRTIFPESLEDEIYTTKLDFHLMVNEPISWVERCMRGNADRIIGQVEQMSDQAAFVDKVLSFGVLVGLAVDLSTEVIDIDPDIIPLLDVILVMSVEAGFGGQSFNKQALSKIEGLINLREENAYKFNVCDDGGVTIENGSVLSQKGVDEVAIGRRLFDGDLENNMNLFKKAFLR